MSTDDADTDRPVALSGPRAGEVAGPGSQWCPFDPRIVQIWRIRTILLSVAVLGVIVPLPFLLPSTERWLRQVRMGAVVLIVVTLVVAAVRVISIQWRYRLSRWRLEGAFVEFESGWWRTVTERMPIDRIHTLGISQGPLLRRHSLFQVSLHASGGSGMLVLPALGADDLDRVRCHLEFDDD